MLGNVVRIFQDVGHDFVSLNAGSHVPVGPENHVLDLFLKERRLVAAVGFSNDDVLVEGDGAIRVHRAYAKLGKIHNHGRLREGMRKPAPPFERQLDLANADRRRRIEFIDRARVKVAGGSFPMSVLVMLYTRDERTVIEGCIRIQLFPRWNVTDDLKKPSQSDQSSVGLAGMHSLRDRWQLLPLNLMCVTFIHRQELEQLPVAREGRFQLLDFGGWIGCIQDLGLNEFRQRELYPSHIELKLEFLGIYAPTVDGTDVAHCRDRKRGIERGQVLFGRILIQLEEAALPSRAVVVLRVESFRVRI